MFKKLVLFAFLLCSSVAAHAAQQDVTSYFTVKATGFILNRATGTFNSSVTLTNNSPSTFSPVWFVVSGLPSGVSLSNSNSSKVNGAYQILVPLANNQLLPGASISLIIQLSNPSRVSVSPTYQVLAQLIENLPGGISFNYPTFGEPTQLDVSNGTDGSVIVSAFSFSAGSQPISQYIVDFIPNSTRQSLIQWFAQEIDCSGSILGSGNYQLTTLQNGVQVLEVTGELPVAHLDSCGPINNLYALSPSGGTVITIASGQEHRFGSIGGSPDEIQSLYFGLLQSLTFQSQ